MAPTASASSSSGKSAAQAKRIAAANTNNAVPNSIPDWAAGLSGFSSTIMIIWCLTWAMLALTIDGKLLTAHIMNDPFLFAFMTFSPLTCMLTIDRAFNWGRVQHTNRGSLILGLSRVIGATVILIFLKFQYFDVLHTINKYG